MSQRGIRIVLPVFDGKITISHTNYDFENTTKNFENTTKRPVYKAYGPNRLADNFTNTTLCGRKHAASKRKTDAVGHRSEHPGKSGSCRMRNNPFRIFWGGRGLTKHVRAQEYLFAGNGRRSSELREESSARKPEIALHPAGKLRRTTLSRASGRDGI